MAIENISQDIADLLTTKDYDVKYTDGQGKDCAPSDAKTFAFDWVAQSGQNYGTMVIVLGNENDLQLFFGDNLGKTMENPQDKLNWFGSERETGFLPELKNFATQHRYTFSPKNINQLKHTMQGMAAIKEGLFEGYYGTRRISYVGEATQARLVIKHNRMIGEDDKRYRYVESLFIETVDGERFRLPFVKLSGGRAMLEHVKQGGRPYDIRGQHINEIVSEMAVLSRFNRASQQRVFEGVTQELVETVQHYYSGLRESLQHIASHRGYTQYFESWTPADIGDGSALVEDLKTMFVEQTLDARIEAALPTLAKIQQQGNAMKEAQIFENWANSITEGTWALPDNPEAQAKLTELMSQELIVGPDATNATEQLYDVIGDDQLFDILSDLAEQDPRANIWDDTDVQARLQELGIQPNTTLDAEQQPPVAEGAEDKIAQLKKDYSTAMHWSENAKSPQEREEYRRKALKIKNHLEKQYKQSVEEGFSDTIKRGVKSVKRVLDREMKKRGLGEEGMEEGVIGNIANKVMGAAPETPKYQVGQRVNYETSPPQPDWEDGGRGTGVITAYKNGHYMINGHPVNHFEIKSVEQGTAEDQLDELSPNTLGNYVNRAVDDVADRSNSTGFRKGTRVASQAFAGGNQEPSGFEKDPRIANRKVGISRAVGRMEESAELATMLKYAGVSLKESVLTDSTGHTLDHILKRFGREVADFKAGAELDNDLFDALYDYYFDDMPYGVKKARTGDPHEWISDRLADELGITEGAAVDAYMAGKSPAIAHFADQLDKIDETPLAQCNSTMEGEYCPEHGLMECGMHEMGTVAGSMAPVMGEQQGAYYESKADTALLSRIKSLALLK